MAWIDTNAFMDDFGIRKARFGGLEPEDVRLALQELGAQYEKRLAELAAQHRNTANAGAALEKHCQTLTAQNRLLAEQNVSLSTSNEKFSRQARVLDGQNGELKARNRSLTDQNAVLTLKNNDLTKENAQLRERTDTAEATLNVKGRALEEEKQNLARSQRELLAKAQAEAARAVAAGEEKARQTMATAQANAAAIELAARTQSQAQAQELINNAAHEADEIYNVHQLRLNSLKNEVAAMQGYRDDLMSYLQEMGETLLALREKAERRAPDLADPLPPDPKPVGQVPAQLDLSPEAIARTAGELAAAPAAPAPAAPAAVPAADAAGGGADPAQENALAPPAPPRAEPAPAPPAAPAALPGPAPALDLSNGEPAPLHHYAPEQEAAPGEVPGAPVGAIFSSPIINPEPELHPDVPRPGPHTPVLPTLGDDEDDAPPRPARREPDVSDTLEFVIPHGARAASPARQNAAGGGGTAARRAPAARRARALRAVRALHRLRTAGLSGRAGMRSG